MNFEGRWICRNGEIYALQRVERPGGLYLEGDEVYNSPDRADLRWDREGNAFLEEPSIYKYQEKQWNRAQLFDLIERISEKDQRR
jgi:hypothetical protein